MNIFKKYFEKKKETEQPKPVTNGDFLSSLQKLSEEAKAKRKSDLHARAYEEARGAYHDITEGMMEAADRGDFAYDYATIYQFGGVDYLYALKKCFEDMPSFKDMKLTCGRVGSDSGINTQGVRFNWEKRNMPNYPLSSPR